MKPETKPTPPKIVKAPEGCKRNLTPNKEYKVLRHDNVSSKYLGFGLYIEDDDGHEIFTLERYSSDLNDQNWIIVEREKESE